MQNEREQHMLALEQQSDADFIIAKQELIELKRREIDQEGEIARLDAALQEIRIRKSRLSGSRAEYLQQKAEALTAHLLGGGEGESLTQGVAEHSDLDLQASANLLEGRRREAVRDQSIIKSQVRLKERECYTLLSIQAAVEYERARAEFFEKWCKATALSDLAGSGVLSDPQEWEKIYIPSATICKSLRVNKHASQSIALTNGAAAQPVYKYQFHAKRKVEE